MVIAVEAADPESFEIDEPEYYELAYGAKAWKYKRRVVLPATPTPNIQRFHFYYPDATLTKENYAGAPLAAMYGRRRKAEKHQGGMKAACSMALSSSPRTTSHYRNKPVGRQKPSKQAGNGPVRLQTAARLQVFMRVYQLLHVGRCISNNMPGGLSDLAVPELIESPAEDALQSQAAGQ